VRGSEAPVGRIVPHLVVHDAAGASRFYQQALGAIEIYRSPQPGGRGLHIHLRIADHVFMVADRPETSDPSGFDAHYRIDAPHALGGTTAVMQVFVDDVDATYQRAVDEGAQPTVPPFNAFWGDRYGCVTDPFGHVWALSTVQAVLSPEEIEARMRQFEHQREDQ
jgi:PhnB protein